MATNINPSTFDPTKGVDVGSVNTQDEFAGYGTAFLNPDRFVLEMDERIHLINPSASPFLSWASMVRKRPTPQYVYSWMEDELFTHRDLTALLVRDANDVFTLRMKHGGDWQAFEACPLADALAGFDTKKPSIYVSVTDGTNTFKFLPLAAGLAEGPGSYSYTDAGTNTTTKHGEFILLDYSDGVTENIGGNGTMDNYQLHCYSKAGDANDIDYATLNTMLAAEGTLEVKVHVATPDEQLKGYAQGSGLPNETRKRSRSKHNYTQIFKTPYSIAETLKAVKLYGGPELQRLRLRKAIQHKVELERAILFQGGGEEGVDWGELPMDGAENPLTRFKGLGVGVTDRDKAGWIVTKNADFEAASHPLNFQYGSGDVSALNDLCDVIFDDTVDDPSDTKVVFAGKKVMLALSTMATNMNASGQFVFGMINQSGNSLGLTIKTLESPVGNLRFVPMPLFRGQYEDYALVVDMKNIEIRPLATRDTKLFSNVGSKEIDGQLDYYLTETGFEVKHESCNALIKLNHS